jgi:FMN phosphatase YigB (HAD superfamily)
MPELVFLIDVDNTLLDNDILKSDLSREIGAVLGAAKLDAFWRIYEEVREEHNFVDLPATVDRFGTRFGPADGAVARDILDTLPFHAYVYAGVPAAINWLSSLGSVVIVSDGDPVFQKRKIEQSGLAALVGGRVVLTVHKQTEMAAIFAAFAADRYVMIDDKTTILSDLKRTYGDRVITVLVEQGKYSRVPADIPPDLRYAGISDLAGLSLETRASPTSMA